MVISLTYLSRVLCRLLLTAILILNLSAVQASERQIAAANPTQTPADNANSIAGSPGLSADSMNLAKSLGILPQLDQLQALKRTTSSSNNELTALKIDLLESILLDLLS